MWVDDDDDDDGSIGLGIHTGNATRSTHLYLIYLGRLRQGLKGSLQCRSNRTYLYYYTK